MEQLSINYKLDLIGKCSIDCSPDAVCVKDKSNQSQCACVEGFEGDGQICVGKLQMIIFILKESFHFIWWFKILIQINKSF